MRGKGHRDRYRPCPGAGHPGLRSNVLQVNGKVQQVHVTAREEIAQSMAGGPPSPQVGPTDRICLPGQGHSRSSQYATLLGRSVLGRLGHRMCLPNHGGRGCRGTERLVHTLPRSVSSHTASAQYVATRKTRPKSWDETSGARSAEEREVGSS